MKEKVLERDNNRYSDLWLRRRMEYQYNLELHFYGRFETVENLRSFMDSLRDFLRTYQIDEYEHTTEEEDGVISTETKFSKSLESRDALRDFLDEVRGFLRDNNVKKYSYCETAKLAKTPSEVFHSVQ